ncbi:MAG TPA: ABC transporter ATP-binding protein [Candidatus Enterococcus avicola]|uniref:ABC transporter ATP-binding protein n=1 Tax=Candidatus Enterococcus avicola TaxID=2838561 RepID=A0A9D2F7V8_9ENTE|nr:ABC transporter ATP-binding protein [Candidatus Enterococcus avicola]
MFAIDIQHFSKKYRGKEVIHDLNLQVNEGEIYGFIGPNGAGKSTTIKALLDFIKPTTGDLAIFSLDSQKQAKTIRQFTSYVSSEVRFYPNFTTLELLKITAQLHQLDQPKKAINDLIDLFDIAPHKKVSELSLGNRKKIALAASLLPNPRLLILDEPTNGLDPAIQHRLFNELKKRNAQGMTIFLSSHNLTEIQDYADRAAFIREGEIITVQTISKETSLGKLVKIDSKTLQTQDFPASFKVLDHNNQQWRLLYTGENKELLQFLSQPTIQDFTVQTPTLEDQFLSLYEGGNLK